MRLLVANLDCEADMARAAGAPPSQLPGPVLQRISALGTLMAVFGQRGDSLWTPLPVNPDRLPAHTPVSLCTGALARLPRPDAVLAWGETHQTAALRPSAAVLRVPETDDTRDAHAGPEARDTGDWPALLWQLHPAAEAAWRCNDRRFCFALSQDLGRQLPGAALLDSVEALHAHLAGGGASAGHEQAWVLKAPFSAAGRLRLRRRGTSLDEASRTHAARLFARFGVLCFEPWVERVRDLGCLGLIETADRWRVFPPHGLETDAAGVFRGIEVHDDPAWLGDEHGREVVATAEACARALARAGYRGPFGIDGFIYATRTRALQLQPMCEINARLSFGFLAHAHAHAHGLARARLRLGAGPVPAGSGIIPLLLPGNVDEASDSAAAWLEPL